MYLHHYQWLNIFLLFFILILSYSLISLYSESVALKRFIENSNKAIPSRRLQQHSYESPSSFKRQVSKRIFIDLGATDASAVQSFLGLKPSADDSAGNGASKGFSGKGKNQTWDIYTVEANPKWGEALTTAKEAIKSSGLTKSFHILSGVAIGNYDGSIELIYDAESEEQSSYGTSIFPETRRKHTKGPIVKIMDIITFFRDVVRAKHHDYVILKMDIEAAEYDVLRRLYTSGYIKLIDELYVEFHTYKPGFRPGQFDMEHKCINWILKDSQNMTWSNWKR